MKPCPRCGSDHVLVGWSNITTDLLPWADDTTGAIHQHAHGWLHVNWQCRTCKFEWDTNEEHRLRCWCGWQGKLSESK